jgi:steroid 5-alpha reductase family enzyme
MWWIILGPVAMTLLFVFISVPLIDKHMLRKRPGYEKQMRELRGMLPLPRKRLG